MAALSTVQDYIDAARFLLQDTTATYRYSDARIVEGLNLAVGELIRVRPDLMFKEIRADTVAYYNEASPSVAVSIPVPYAMPTLYFVVGYTQLSDVEDTQDQRSMALIAKYTAQLMSSGGAR
jgi:hypothetical protein